MAVDHYENFPVASFLLPPHLREAVAAIYYFARTADDIADEGTHPSSVRIAALAVKKHNRCVPGLVADYAGLSVPDRYVYGYGMDYYEQGRNLPAIHALRE